MSNTFKIFCADNLPFLDEVKHLFTNVEIDCWTEPTTITADAYRNAFKTYDGVITIHSVRIDDKLFDDEFRVKVISTYGTGQDYLDKPFLASKGIKVIGIYDEHVYSTAELTLALALNCIRNISTSNNYVKSGEWNSTGLTLFMGDNLYNKTWGIMGMGKIGLKLAEMLKVFNCNVIYTANSDHNNGYEYCTKEDLLKRSDIVSLHIPLKEDTVNYINEGELNLMKKNAILVNVARGKVINNAKLYQFLKDGRIASAALDVTDPEPISDPDVVNIPNLLITPHIGTAAAYARKEMTRAAISNLISLLEE
ncbi:NAD(P)-dependent oxidoreductase [Mucilaginibacter auburnensis]|uniref:Glyoxylate reductase n=1 Tax=Mucilaginibacter auburnensis TaxID=1457233 RepID=A0A2H9VM17_9SPHI|nr:NAD(P)-dependent oxidoreductase [Mucilaginibacter auburnensis]PJJ79378.1 glyoxylate reductase [Mucilaginibacter auburnensis]